MAICDDYLSRHQDIKERQSAVMHYSGTGLGYYPVRRSNNDDNASLITMIIMVTNTESCVTSSYITGPVITGRRASGSRPQPAAYSRGIEVFDLQRAAATCVGHGEGSMSIKLDSNPH